MICTLSDLDVMLYYAAGQLSLIGLSMNSFRSLSLLFYGTIPLYHHHTCTCSPTLDTMLATFNNFSRNIFRRKLKKIEYQGTENR